MLSMCHQLMERSVFGEWTREQYISWLLSYASTASHNTINISVKTVIWQLDTKTLPHKNNKELKL